MTFPIRLSVLLFVSLVVPGCGALAVAAAPARVPAARSAATAEGEALFSAVLVRGDYAALPDVTAGLTRLALAHPRDGRLHLMLGMAHLWALSEHTRAPGPDATVTDHAVLARHYLESARALLPDDARIDGWSAAALLASSALLEDERGRRQAFFQLKAGAAAWPEFNGFSASYALSRMNPADPKYDAEVVQPMFDTAQRCWGKADTWDARRTSLQRPAGEPAREKRVCFNSPGVPHNVEGFFLHFGDALARAGRVDDARAAWGLATTVPSYGAWPHRPVLEQRLARTADEARQSAGAPNGAGLMVASAQACSGCHQGP